MSSTFHAHSAEVAAAIESGASLADAARQAGVGRRTVDRWLQRGRAGANGYRDFARRVDAIRQQSAPVPEDGAVTAALRSMLAEIQLDAPGRVLAETGLALARKLDHAAASDAAAASTATPQLARQLIELLDALPGAPGHVDKAMKALATARGRDQ